MNPEFVVFLLAGAAMGGFINGLAGFGTALFALGWWLQVMPPVEAVAIVLFMSVASGIQGMILVRKSIEWRRLALFLVPGLLGIPLGLAFLHMIDGGLLKIVVAGFLLIYGGFFIIRRDLPKLVRPTPWIDGGIGFAGGFLGAVAGLSGALPTMWLALRDQAKERTRAVLQPYNVVILGVAAVLLAFQGGYRTTIVINIAIALPATMIAAQIGLWTFKRLDDQQFRRLLIAMMFISGVILLVRTLT